MGPDLQLHLLFVGIPIAIVTECEGVSSDFDTPKMTESNEIESAR